jgi:drug/metabolite transporter (DMT)-like permease
MFRLRAARSSWIAATVSLVGLGFIFFGEFSLPLHLNPGDALMVGSASLFALHVLLIGRYTENTNYAQLLILQIATVVCLAFLGTLLLEPKLLPPSPWDWLRILLAGLFSTALAFWLQNRFQYNSASDKVAIIYSTEPLFAAFFGFLYLGETLHRWQWAGAVLIIVAMTAALRSVRSR